MEQLTSGKRSTNRSAIEREIENAEIAANTLRINRAMAVVASRNIVDWRDEALCSAMDPSSFDTALLLKKDVERAKEVCGMCNAQDECLIRGLAQDPSDTMIWGGLDRDQMATMWRRARRTQRAEIENAKQARR